MKSPRILIAGFEIGGQMQLLAETMRKRGIEATSVAFNNDFRGFSNDIKINRRNTLDQFLFFLWAVRHYHIFHFFWGVSLLDVWRFHNLDLPILNILGKKTFPHFRGLDVIDIKYFDYLRAQTNGENLPIPPMSRPDQQRSLRKWIKHSSRLLISEPDLHQVVPNAILSPQVIDLSYWRSDKMPLSIQDGIIRIVHAPTSRRKKGTEYLEQAVERLIQKGYRVELLMAEKIQSHHIKEYYEQADIGVDQLLYGWHGKVSCELMAMRKPVVCFINPEYGKYRSDLPIVNATPKTIEFELEKLILSKDLRVDIGESGFEYVKRYHDVEVVVDELFELYGLAVRNLRHSNKMDEASTW